MLTQRYLDGRGRAGPTNFEFLTGSPPVLAKFLKQIGEEPGELPWDEAFTCEVCRYCEELECGNYCPHQWEKDNVVMWWLMRQAG